MAAKKTNTVAKDEIKPILSKGPRAQNGKNGNAKPETAPKPPTELGREIKTEIKAGPVAVQEPKLSPEEQERRKKMKELDEAMLKFNMYPVAAGEDAKKEALATLRKAYIGGDGNIKQVVLYMLHETISQVSEYRAPKNFEYFRKKFPQNDPSQNRVNVYRGMFNYTSSIDGLMEIAGLLGELGDTDAAKVLTHNFSFLCSYDGSESSRMLRGAIVDALGECKSVYALKALLAYVENTENEQLAGRMIAAILEWKGRIHELKISQKEKDEFLAKINDLTMQEREEGHYR